MNSFPEAFLHNFFACALLALTVGACAQLPASDGAPTTSAAPQTPCTQVFVLGMIHDQHRSSELWGLEQVRETIRAINPDVICPEIPPDRWPEAFALWKDKHEIQDDRILQFPEYVDVLLPLTDEMEFVVEPAAGWRREMAVYRQAQMKTFRTDPAYAEEYAAYQKAEDWVAAWMSAHPVAQAEDDPFYIHSPAYDLRTKGELGPYEQYMTEIIGRPGAWPYINEEHFVLIETAIRMHPGSRILITFGAGHKYWFLEQLKNMPDVEVHDVRPYLPLEETWQLSPEEQAVEAFYRGIDNLEIWRALMRGDALFAWDHFENMLAMPAVVKEQKLAHWKAQKGIVQSEFLGHMWFGTPIVHHQAGSDTFDIEVEVQWALHPAADGGTVRATLVKDASYWGGYAWTALEVPDYAWTALEVPDPPQE